MPDWSQRLPEPIRTQRGTLRTLADISAFLQKVPGEEQAWRRWEHAASIAIDAAEGRADPRSAWVAFKLGGLQW